MEFKYIMGVDISKEWFHFCLKDRCLAIIWEGQVTNQADAIFTFLSQLTQRAEIEHIQDVVLCMEHTGIYGQHLLRCWSSKGGRLCLIPAAKVSEQLAGAQGWSEKDDLIDARRLAEYGLRFPDQLSLWQPQGAALEKLRSLHRQRERLIKVINILEVPVVESQEFDSADIAASMQRHQARSIKALEKDLKKVEATLKKLIHQGPELNQLFNLITSVEGIGPVTAIEIIITTEAFVKFTPKQAKKFARYNGVIPMKWQSGSSVRKRTRTPKRTNQKLKTLLTTGALSLIPTSNELAHYYHRKRQEGKPHLSVINAMRNKMILRVFAVVRNQVMYEKNLNHSLDLP